MYFLLTTFLACVCFIGDHLLQISNSNLSKAVVDSSTHGLVAILSWLIVVLKCHQRSTMLINSVIELLLCGILATSIDLDHFILARSLRLKDALSLGKKRPILHCTTLPVVILLTCLIVGWTYDLPRVLRFGWLAWVALFSHHIRDSWRRGLWLWPLGSSPPLPYYLYLVVTLALPYLVIIPLNSRKTTSVLLTEFVTV